MLLNCLTFIGPKNVKQSGFRVPYIYIRNQSAANTQAKRIKENIFIKLCVCERRVMRIQISYFSPGENLIPFSYTSNFEKINIS